MAAKLTKYPMRGVNSKEVVMVVGSFTPDTNTSYPHSVAVSSKTNGAQFTVTKTAAGTYQVNMLDRFVTCLQMDVAIAVLLPSGATGSALALAVSAYDTTNQRFTLRLYNPTSALVSSDVTAVEPSSVPTGAQVQFCALFRVTGSPD